MKVLYIDDDRINALLFEETARFVPGVSIESVGSATEALDFAPGFAPDLLVIDLHLPDGDGLALLPQLRAALGRPALPAVLCSADDSVELAARAEAAGFGARWSKPVQIPAVIAELRRLEASGSGAGVGTA